MTRNEPEPFYDDVDEIDEPEYYDIGYLDADLETLWANVPVIAPAYIVTTQVYQFTEKELAA